MQFMIIDDIVIIGLIVALILEYLIFPRLIVPHTDSYVFRKVFSVINKREKELQKEWDSKKDDKKYSQVYLACLDGHRAEAAWILHLLVKLSQKYKQNDL